MMCRCSVMGRAILFVMVVLAACAGVLLVKPAAQAADGTTFHAVITDTQGVETDVTDFVFFWEEKVNDNEVALYELRHLPMKRGAATIKMENIQNIQINPSDNGSGPTFSITVNSGKTGEFSLAQEGYFKGQTDFGELVARPQDVRQILLKENLE